MRKFILGDSWGQAELSLIERRGEVPKVQLEIVVRGVRKRTFIPYSQVDDLIVWLKAVLNERTFWQLQKKFPGADIRVPGREYRWEPRSDSSRIQIQKHEVNE